MESLGVRGKPIQTNLHAIWHVESIKALQTIGLWVWTLSHSHSQPNSIAKLRFGPFKLITSESRLSIANLYPPNPQKKTLFRRSPPALTWPWLCICWNRLRKPGLDSSRKSRHLFCGKQISEFTSWIANSALALENLQEFLLAGQVESQGTFCLPR